MDYFDINFDGVEEEFYIDFKRVSETENLLPTIRLTALSLMSNPYLSLGDWFKGLNDHSFAEINDLIDESFDEDGDEMFNSDMLEQFMLLTLMLSAAEGTLGSSRDVERMGSQMHTLRTYVTIVSLERKGLVRVFYENLTLGTDMGDKIVVEKI